MNEFLGFGSIRGRVIGLFRYLIDDESLRADATGCKRYTLSAKVVSDAILPVVPVGTDEGLREHVLYQAKFGTRIWVVDFSSEETPRGTH